MDTSGRRSFATRIREYILLVVLAGALLLPGIAAAQGLTGALIGTVKDEQGGVLPGAVVRVSSPALIGGPATLTTNEKGQLRFPALPPGPYVLDIEMQGFATYPRGGHPYRGGRHHRENGCPEAGRPRGIGRRRGSGLAHRSTRPRIRDSLRPRGPQEPSRRDGSSMFDFDQGRARHLAHLAVERHRPPPCPRSAPAPTRTSFSSTARTSPARATASRAPSRASTSFRKCKSSPSGASAEFGNVQGAVINVVTRQGSERFLYDASYYGQTAGLTSQPVLLPVPGAGDAHKRVRARQVPRLHDEPRWSGRSRSALVLRGIPVSARLRQSAGHRSRASRGPTSRTRSSRSSRGDWLRAGSWCKACTTSSGSTPNNRRS